LETDGPCQKIVATGETSKPQGENPTGTVMFSHGGYFTWIFIADGRKSPEKLPPTDAERIYLYNTGGSASGSYKINGDKVTFLYNASTNQAFTGTKRVQTMQVSGKVLTWTSAPFKDDNGKDAIATITFERLE
jgi:lipocalin-like protein